MIVFRLSRYKYCRELSGKGAEKAGGRWNSKGVPIIYTGESRALCTLEIAVHLPLSLLPPDFKIVSISIPDSIKVFEIKTLPFNWDSIPHSSGSQRVGDDFVKQNKFAVMKVSSAVVKGEFNFLINPSHHDFKKIEIIEVEDFNFDSRLGL